MLCVVNRGDGDAFKSTEDCPQNQRLAPKPKTGPKTKTKTKKPVKKYSNYLFTRIYVL